MPALLISASMRPKSRTASSAAFVTTGATVESRRVITTGLTGGEWVVVNGVLKAAPGRPVTPEREGAPGPEAHPSLPEKKAAP